MLTDTTFAWLRRYDRRTLAAGAALLMAALFPSIVSAQRIEEGKREVRVPRYGVFVTCPQAWSVIDWANGVKAFVLQVPQEPESPLGFASCEMHLAPERLEDVRLELEQHAEQEGWKLLSLAVEPASMDADPTMTADVLVSLREHRDAKQHKTFELVHQWIRGDLLYRFALHCDEAHFEAYRLDFQEMLETAKLSPPPTAIEKLPPGRWTEVDQRIAVALPDGWSPTFSVAKGVAFTAIGVRHGLVVDRLTIHPTTRRELDVERLAAESRKRPAADEDSKLLRVNIVPQAQSRAVETVVQTVEHGQAVVHLTRRFEADTRNFELRIVCHKETFDRHEATLLDIFGSFREVAEAAPAAAF